MRTGEGEGSAGGSVGFNKEKLSYIAAQTTTVCNLINSQDETLNSNIQAIMNQDNWSGPLRNSAEVELNEIKTAWPQLVTDFNELKRILNETSNNFEGIKYNASEEGK